MMAKAGPQAAWKAMASPTCKNAWSSSAAVLRGKPVRATALSYGWNCRSETMMSNLDNLLITVAIVEDDAQVRQSLANILKRGSGVVCVGEHANAEEAVREIPRVQPKVVLMDINLPGMDGVHCVRRLSELAPATQVVMLTVYDNTDAIFNSLAAGAHGYLLKPISSEQLLLAIRDVYAGGAPMTSDIARKVVQAFKQPV